MPNTRVLNYGSINEDRVYRVDTLAKPGETVTGRDFRIGAGGKGANQSVALAHAGASVYHAGKVGRDGIWLRDRLNSEGVDVSMVATADAPTGHAVIQVEKSGENSIVIYGGTNRQIAPEEVKITVAQFRKGDMLLIQNETNCIPELIRAAHTQGMQVCFNPAPMTAEVKSFPLDLVDLFMLNQHEAAVLTGRNNPDCIFRDLRARFPHAVAVVTWGSRGCYVAGDGGPLLIPAKKVDVVDTTAAGDTFVGYCITGLLRKLPLHDACRLATTAAALCVTKSGAMDSIPTYAAVEKAAAAAKV